MFPTRHTGIVCFVLAALGAHGQFGEPVTLPCSSCPFPFVADVDGLNGPDLVLPSFTSITWMANDGNANFSAPEELTTNPLFLNIGIAQDLDDDSDIDLVGVTSPLVDSLVVLLRNDNGDFSTHVIDTISPTFRTLRTVVDLDGDTRLDLLGIGSGDEELWYRQADDGSFARERIKSWCQAGVSGPYTPVDAEGDGDLDLVGFVQGLNKLVVHWNLGDAVFGPFTLASGYLGSFPAGPALAAADVDNDGFTDIVAGGRTLRSTGDGTFIGSGLGISSNEYQTIGNVDCDGSLEALLSSQSAADVNDFDLTTELAYFLNIPGNVRSTIADLDGDGRPELITLSAGTLQLHMNISEPEPTFLTLDPDTAFNADPIVLTGGEPTSGGGFYSGEGVLDGVFYPALAGPGPTVITYSHSDFNDFTACIGTATDTLFVVDFTGTSEHDIPRISVYPNPARQALFVDPGMTCPCDLGIRDMLGRNVLLPTGQTLHGPGSVNISSLPAGSYLLTLRTDTTGSVTPFVVQH